MKKTIIRKNLVLGIVVLFVGAGVIPVLSGTNSKTVSSFPDDDTVHITVQAMGDSTRITYQLNGFTQERIPINDNIYSRLLLEEESMILETGFPELPHICRSIIIPDTGAMGIRVVSAEYQEYQDMLIAPSKGVLYRTVNPDEVPFEFGDVYTIDGWYPSQIATLQEPYIVRDFRGQVVNVNPFQYNPVTKTLRFYTEITVETYSTGSPGFNELYREEPLTSVDSDFADIYEDHFLNYGGDRYTPVEERGRLLVITYDSFWDTMLPFVQWKNMKGTLTEMVRVSTIGATSTAIDNYITNYYYAHGLTFVLLVGDAAQIPTMIASGGASDPSYSYIVGSDHYPDLFVGRFSATTVAQVQTQVLRSVEYEKLPQVGAAWYHKGVGIGSDQGAGIGDEGEADWQHMRNLRTELLNYVYTDVDELYDGSHGGGDAAGDPTTTMVATAINNGRSIINYCGHGWAQGWGTTGYSNTNINQLVNDNMLPFIQSVACNNGEFNNYDACFGEAWLRATHNNEPIGAIGCFASSISQSWAPPMDAQDEFVDILRESYANNKKNTYGGLCFNGCMHMNDQYGSDGWEMTDTWIIFGDPSLQVRTNTPSVMTVQHAPVVPSQATTFEVTVVGLKDALCAISRNYILLGSAYTDASGHATIAFSEPVSEGPVDLVVTAYNKIPYLTQLPVGPSVDPDLSFVTLTNTNMPGLLTCPKGDGPIYEYIQITVKDTQGDPMPDLPAEEFVFTLGGLEADWYGLLHCTFTPVDLTTNANGQISFTIKADTSIVGNISIRVTVANVPLNDIERLPCKCWDYFCDGACALGDFVTFAQDYGDPGWRSDYTWDGMVAMPDFVMFAQHYGHRHL